MLRSLSFLAYASIPCLILFGTTVAAAPDIDTRMGQASVRHAKRDQYNGFDDPRANGGYMLTVSWYIFF